MKIYTLNAFSKNGKGGNPAGVCLHADPLTEAQMLRIAQKVGFSETAFVQRSKRADFRVRFFTKTREIPLCGHATIATFSLLYQLGSVRPRLYTQETGAGILSLEITADGTIFMNQNPPQFVGTLSREEAASCLRLATSDLLHLPAEIISTGLPTVIIPIRSLAVLHAIRPDLEKIAEVSRRYSKALFYAFSLEHQLPESTTQGRMFDPLDGIPEESATGVASGALACYLFRHRLVRDPSRMVLEQGYAMGQPSEILARLEVEGMCIEDVTVGGTAVRTGEMEMEGITGMTEKEIETLLQTSKTIAIVGLSDKPDRDSYQVAEYLQKAGYTIVPVNPNIHEWKGIKAYASLVEIPREIYIGIVDVFRRSEFVGEIVNQASTLRPLPKAIWFQLGIENEKAAEKARNAGMQVIQNKCMKIEHANANRTKP